MLRRRLTPAILAFCVMLACCCFHQPLAGHRPLLICGILASSAAGIVLFRVSPDGLRRAGALLLAISGGVLLGLVCLTRMAHQQLSAYLPCKEAEVSGFAGVLLEDSVLTSKGDTLLRVSLKDVASRARGVTADARGRVLVKVRGDYRFSLGQEIAFQASLAKLDPSTGETYTATVERKDLTRRGYSSLLWSQRAAVREWVHRAISRAGYPASALMEALLIGSREDVPPDLYDGFKKTGSLHILALSGLHVSVLYALLLAILGFLRGRALKLLIATLALAVYQVIAGFMPSLLRATIMIIFAGIGLLLDRDRESLNLLALSGIVVLLASPWQAYSLSFQLSYLALAGILAVGPVFQRILEGFIPKVVLAPFAMGIGAQIATLPIVIARFGVYYPSGLLAGLVLVPLTTLVLWGALAWIVVFVVPWPWLHDLGSQGLSVLYRVIEWTAGAFGTFPGVTIRPQAAAWAIGLSVALMISLAVFVPARRRAQAMQT